MKEHTQRIQVFGGDLVVQVIQPDLQDAAQSPPVHLVFLHEALGCIRLWRDFPAALVNRVKLPGVVIERHGHGEADPFVRQRTHRYLHLEAQEVLPQVLGLLGIEKTILIGHSDGGSIALIFAANFPEKVLGMVSEAAHVFVEPETLAGIRRAGDAYRVPPLREKLMRYHGAHTDALFQAWQDTWLSEKFASWNLEELLPKIQAPVLVIQGEDDAYGTPAQVEAICRQVGGRSESLMLPNCGHEPHREARGPVLSAIAGFIKNLEGFPWPSG